MRINFKRYTTTFTLKFINYQIFILKWTLNFKSNWEIRFLKLLLFQNFKLNNLAIVLLFFFLSQFTNRLIPSIF